MVHVNVGSINSETMKALNLKIVFDYIRRHEPTSRRDIAEYGGLTVASVSKITGKLIEKGLVVETGEGQSVGGRKPAMLGINANCRYAVGIDLTAEYIKLVITNFKAQVIYELHSDTQLERGKEYVLHRLCTLILQSIEESGIDKEKLIGIGLVSAGPCDHEKGSMQSPPNFPGWDNVKIRDYIQENTGFPTFFDKDAVAAVMAEYWFGVASECNSVFACLINQSGFGGGLIANGQIFRGYNDGACEIGHTIIDVHGAKCACGNYGCLETLVNGSLIVKEVTDKLKLGNRSVLSQLDNYDKITLAAILQAVKNGDPLCRSVIDKTADYISAGIQNVATIYSPEIIVLSGNTLWNCDYLIQTVISKVQKRKGNKFIKSMTVVGGTFGENQCALGGVALVLENFYKEVSIEE